MKITYTEEQKKNAVQMLLTQGPHKTREALGIPTNTLYRWKKQFAGVSQEVQVENVDEPVGTAAAVEELPSEQESTESVSTLFGEPFPQIPGAPTKEEIIQQIPLLFMRKLETNPELFANSIIIAIKDLFKENAALAHDNARLRRTLRTLLEEEDEQQKNTI